MFAIVITHFVNLSIRSRFANETTPFVNIRLHVIGFKKNFTDQQFKFRIYRRSLQI